MVNASVKTKLGEKLCGGRSDQGSKRVEEVIKKSVFVWTKDFLCVIKSATGRHAIRSGAHFKVMSIFTDWVWPHRRLRATRFHKRALQSDEIRPFVQGREECQVAACPEKQLATFLSCSCYH
ncbi:hypothetical protein CEXT_48631 [Caerostris extrusa]|uniref:Uncharacterized protein n=1 Tax=Caerostris extrusa TaxID=172846 RepID=A0AAV4N305_CAEEX|nr:hypothetical protein CEXT_48631 [Caerostris extrusa]